MDADSGRDGWAAVWKTFLSPTANVLEGNGQDGDSKNPHFNVSSLR